MKRVIGLMSAALIVIGFGACGKPPKACDPDTLVDKAQLCAERDSIGFGLEFGTGTFIGAAPIESLAIKNGGVEALNVTSVVITGDPEFKYTASWDAMPNGTSIPATMFAGGKTEVIQISFTPKAAKLYSGFITINSNAQNFGTKTFEVHGCGVPTDGGVSPCYRDGGR